jgi:hypothetical protein
VGDRLAVRAGIRDYQFLRTGIESCAPASNPAHRHRILRTGIERCQSSAAKASNQK